MTKAISRRTLLRGTGAAIGLPLLDAMMPAFAKPEPPPCRLMVVYAPSGMMMQHWTPAATGAEYELPRILKPLERHRRDLLVLSGLAANQGNSLGDGPGDHARAASCYLTGVHPKKTEGADIRCGISMDQIAARETGPRTRFASLELTCEDSRQLGSCDSYSCAYQSISWKSESTPLPPEMNPRAVFERLFGDGAGGSPEERARQREVRQSILDLAARDAESMRKNLGAGDRRKLDEYLTSIREIELRIQRAEQQNAQLPPGVEAPGGIPTNYAEHARLLFDLSLLAFRTGSTRVITFMLAREGGLRTYPEAGMPEAHHSVSHHKGDPELIEKVTKVNCYHVEQFAYFVDKLKSTPDGDGTLLDHAVVTYGASIGDPNIHDHGNLPTLLVGRGNGRVRPGFHVRYEKGTPVANLHMTLLDAMGVRPERFGDATGRLDLLGGIPA